MGNIERRIAELPPDKLALLALRVAGGQAERAGSQIVRAPRDGRPIPLSFAQQRLWFLHQLEPESPFYNMPSSSRIRGPYDIAAVTRSLNEIVRRHEALRTTFPATDGQPMQRIAPRLRLDVPVVDLSALGEAEREAEARRLTQEEGRRPFDLERGPLLRARVLRLGEADHVLLLTMHHIISDGWSMGVLRRELDALYDALREGRPSPLPELSIQYADFAVWQRETLQGRLLEEHLRYWRRALDGAPARLELPTDRPRPVVQTFRGSTYTFRLPLSLRRAAQTLSREEGATPFMTLLSAFGALLHRHALQSDIVIGAPIANRTRAELEDLIGFFVNSLALRIDLGRGPTFRELLGRVREVTLGAYAHQDLPFEQLVERLAPARSPGHNPVFQVAFALQNVPGSGAAEAEDENDAPPDSPPPGEEGTAKFDLTLHLMESPRGYIGALEYNVDLFDAGTVERMARRFEVLLTAALARPDLPIAELPLLSDEERRRLLQWSSTAALPSQCSPVHGLFERRAALSPDAPAVISRGETLTYQELNARANRLAHHLRSLGAGREVRVGICLDASPEAAAAVLAVLKAGGAYVPLDPAYPQERLAFMIGDAGLSLLLSRTSLADRLPPCAGAAVILVDAIEEALSGQPSDDPASGVAMDDLAYVIYTSGSTGRPKGAAITHGSLAASMTARFMVYTRSVERYLLVSSLSFDSSVPGLFWPLCQGGAAVLPHEDARSDPEQLAQLIAAERVTHILCVPSLYRLLLELAGDRASRELASLQTVIVAGETCPPALVARHHAALPRARLYNEYGPTEATIWCSVHETRPQDGAAASVPIGRPIPGARLYVLDEARQAAPIGVPGELFIGGSGVARGYHERPELTAERFVPDPFSGVKGARLYRTGDLARFLPDGSLEHLGRIDEQIKLNGHRIEAGEIEAVLGAHPEVQACAVVCRDAGPGRRELVAYLVEARAPGGSSAEGLRAFLEKRLPAYMVPAAFVCLDALPLTPNGKVDRAALKALDPRAPEARLRADRDGGLVAPRSDVEETLAKIWASVLRLEKVGVHDNFFEIGGDSILSIQIVARARQAGLRITPRQMFQHQSIAELASAAGAVVISPVEQGPVIGPVQLTPVQLWWLEQDIAEPHHFNQSVFLHVRDRVDAAALERAFERLIEHHDALRLRLLRGRDGVQQIFAEPGGPAPFELIDLATLPEAEQRDALERVAAEAQASLDLESGPALRAALFDLGERAGQRLLIAVHHMAVDGVSWRILLDDLWQAYEQASRGEAARLPLKTTSFKRWAELLAEHAGSEAVRAELGHWLDPSRRAMAPLPQDRRAGENTWESARCVVVSLTPEETERLLREVPQAYHTRIDEVQLTALALSIAEWTGSPSVLLDLEGHGREEVIGDADVTRTVGWFTTIYPVLLRAGAAGPGEALKAVKEQLRAVPGRGLGYGLLRYLCPETSAALRALPQAELCFNYLGQFDQAIPEDAPLRTAEESPGPDRDPSARRSYLIEVNSVITGGRLYATWVYSEHRHERGTVERLADSFAAALRALIAHCTSPEAGGSTPTDFDSVRLSQEAIDAIDAIDAMDADPSEPAKRRPIEDIYALSPLQAGILFHALYADDHAAYLEQIDWTMEGDFDPDAFARALQSVVDRHPVLRTSFAWERLDAPLQIVRAGVVLPVERADLRGLDPQEQEARVARRIDADRRRGMDLRRAPLMRVALLRLRQDRWRFLWTMHHIILDGWSAQIVIKEILSLYEAHRAGRAIRLEQPRPYGDYIRWLSAQDRRRTAAFWRRELEGLSAPTPLGVDRAAAVDDGGPRFRWLRLTLAATDSERLAAFAPRHQLTMSTLVQGAWAQLLSRYTGETDVLFGLTTSGRSAPIAGIERMVGLFINTIPVRVQARSDAPAHAWLKALQAQVAELLEHEHSPLVEIQAQSDVPRGAPLFESLVVFENYPVESAAEAPAAETSAQTPAAETQPGSREGFRIIDGQYFGDPPYPLTVIAAFDGAFHLKIGHDRRRIDDSAVDRMMEHLAAMLRSFAESPESPVRDLPLLAAGEESAPVLARSSAAPSLSADSPSFGRIEPQGDASLDAPPPSPRAAPPHVAPRNAVEEELAKIWAQVLGVSRIGVQSHFFELGGHSLTAIQVQCRVLESFQTEIPLRCLFEAPTIAELALRVIQLHIEQDSAGEAARMLDELSGLSPEERGSPGPGQAPCSSGDGERAVRESDAQRALEAMDRHTIDGGADGPLTYFSLGQGSSTVFLLSALGQGLTIWDRLILGLSRGYRVIAWEPRGTAGQRPFTLADQAADLARIIAHEQASEPRLVCWCNGARTAFEHLRQGGAAASMVILNGSFKPFPGLERFYTPYEETMGQLCDMVSRKPRLARILMRSVNSVLSGSDGDSPGAADDATMDAVKAMRRAGADVEGTLRAPFKSLASTVHYSCQISQLASTDITAVVQDTTVPALLVAGQLDQVASPEMSRAIAQRMRNAEYVEIAGGTHYCMRESPEIVVDLIERFFEGRGLEGRGLEGLGPEVIHDPRARADTPG